MKTRVISIAIGMILPLAATTSAQSPDVLDQHIGTIDLRQRTIASAVDAVARENGVRIAVSWDGLGGDDLRQTNLNVSLSGCRIRDALGIIFPTAEIYEEVGAVHVVARESAPVSVKTYVVTDVLRVIGPGGADDLVRLVENSVRSDDWADNGGRFQLRVQGGLLVAEQTPAGHEKIGRLLDVLRDGVRMRNNPTAFALPRLSYDLAGRRVADLRFRQTPLDVAISDLLTTSHVPHVIRWDALEIAGIPSGTELTLDLSGRTLAESLGILSELTGAHFMLHDGVVELNVPDADAHYVETRVMDMHPMADLVRDYVSGSSGWRATVNVEAVADAVTKIVEDVVETDSWKDNGGSLGMCRELGDLLVVTNTPRAQNQIAAIMSDIQAASQPASQPAPPAQKPDPLEARIDPLDLRDTTLEDAFDRLGQRAQTQVLVDWKSLESAGVDRNTPVSVKLREGSLRMGLNVVLELAGNGEARLDYRVDDAGIVHVGSADSLGHIGVTRIYNIRDLIGRYADYHNVPQNVPDRQEAVRTDAVDVITKLIEDTVETDSWKDNGGSVGALREFAGLLIVTNTPQAHAKIKGLLESLRTQASVGTGVKQ